VAVVAYCLQALLLLLLLLLLPIEAALMAAAAIGTRERTTAAETPLHAVGVSSLSEYKMS